MTDREPHWTDDALCAQIPGGIASEDDGDGTFFNAATRAEALALCRRCDVVATCLATALAEETGRHRTDRYGVRGGTTPTTRARLDQGHAAA